MSKQKEGTVFKPGLLLFILFLTLITPGKAQKLPEILVEESIEQFHFDLAEKQIPLIPSIGRRHYYLVRILFLKNLLTEDPAYEDPFFLACKAAIRDISALPSSNPLKRTYLSEIYFQRGLIRFMKKNYLGLAADLQKSCDMAEKNQSRFPVNPEQMKLAGGYRVVLSTVPQNWQWLTSFLCFKGEIESGLLNLEKSAKESRLLPFESEIVLYYYEKNILSNPEKAQERMARIAKDKPNYFIYRFLEASSLSGLGRNEEALAILSNGERFRSDPSILWSPIWDRYRAKAHFFKLDFAQAIHYYTRFLKDFKGKTFRGDATFRLGLSFELSGNRKKSQQVFTSISNVESSGLDMDDYAVAMAKKYAKRAMTQNEILLAQARNLFDGGYYQKSLARLKKAATNIESLSQDEKTEFYYRMGRNYGALNKVKQAQHWYTLCMRQLPADALWMKVYAAFYAGKLMEEELEFEKAKLLYQYALTFNEYFYQGGLEQRCKAALQKLKKQ